MSRLADPEVLFKDKAWKITGIPGDEEEMDEVWHKCKWKKNLLKNHYCSSASIFGETETCSHCGETAPESIIGVWKLKNFDLIQQQQDYQSPIRLWPTTFYGSSPTFIGYNAGLHLNTTGSSNSCIGPGDVTEFYVGPGSIMIYDPEES